MNNQIDEGVIGQYETGVDVLKQGINIKSQCLSKWPGTICIWHLDSTANYHTWTSLLATKYFINIWSYYNMSTILYLFYYLLTFFPSIFNTYGTQQIKPIEERKCLFPSCLRTDIYAYVQYEWILMKIRKEFLGATIMREWWIFHNLQ